MKGQDSDSPDGAQTNKTKHRLLQFASCKSCYSDEVFWHKESSTGVSVQQDLPPVVTEDTEGSQGASDRLP